MSQKYLYDIIREKKAVLLPGAYDALSARIAEQAGFEAIVLGGFATTASIMGMPDFGLLHQGEVVRTARYVANAVNIPVIVDADTGYGGPINAIRTVQELELAGVQGMILEDQVWPKRCGEMLGKKVIPMEEFEQKLLAALEARKDPTRFLITARTDALGPHGMDEALKRANRYHELGADIVYVEGPRTREDLEIIGKNVPGPLTALHIEGGLSPAVSVKEYEAMGFQFIGFVLSTVFAAAKAIKDVLVELKATQSTKTCESNMVSYQEFTEMVGLQKLYALEQKYSIPKC